MPIEVLLLTGSACVVINGYFTSVISDVEDVELVMQAESIWVIPDNYLHDDTM